MHPSSGKSVSITLFLLFLPSARPFDSPDEPAGDLDSVRRRCSKGGVYRRPDPEELGRARELFIRTFAVEEEKGDEVAKRPGRTVAALRREWSALGFMLEKRRRADDTWLLITEREHRREGRGLYAVRAGNSVPVMIQAPHGFHDLHTGELGARLFEESSFVAGAWNTVPRGTGAGREAADVAHLENSYFMEFVKAFASRYREGTVLQLHGFSRSRRKTREGREARIILSEGTRSPGERFFSYRACLESVFGQGVKGFPGQVVELGGTRNRMARWFRTRGRGVFVHLEMSLRVRKVLRKEEGKRRDLAACFGGS